MAKLYFYYSTMNAGKTTTLLQSAYNYHERGMRTLILTPRLDNRAGEGIVASRIGLKASAVTFTGGDDLAALVRQALAAKGKIDCVLIDEAQFLSKAQVWQLARVADRLGLPVLWAALSWDQLQAEPIGELASLSGRSFALALAASGITVAAGLLLAAAGASPSHQQLPLIVAGFVLALLVIWLKLRSALQSQLRLMVKNMK